MDHLQEDANELDKCTVRCIHQERIAAAQKQALPEADTLALANLFKAMADAHRLRLLWGLHHGEMCVCDLAVLAGSSESAVSHQLRLLRQMGLVRNRRQGQVLYYQLDDAHVHSLICLALEHVREGKHDE